MSDQALRTQLVNLLTMQQAHMNFEDAVAKFAPANYNTRPPNVEYTFWHLLEHLRLTQWDILDYIRNPETMPVFEIPPMMDDDLHGGQHYYA